MHDNYPPTPQRHFIYRLIQWIPRENVWDSCDKHYNETGHVFCQWHLSTKYIQASFYNHQKHNNKDSNLFSSPFEIPPPAITKTQTVTLRHVLAIFALNNKQPDTYSLPSPSRLMITRQGLLLAKITQKVMPKNSFDRLKMLND